MTDLTPDRRDALHDYVVECQRLAVQHKPRKVLREHLYDLRHTQLRRWNATVREQKAKVKFDAKVTETEVFWREWLRSLGKMVRSAA